MESNITPLSFAERFEQAYKIRFDKTEIDYKEVGGGTKLAYLNWATAWAWFAKIYPDGHIEVIERDGNPLWDVNGFGVIKVKGEACGFSYTEVFPIMDNRNNAIKTEAVDARDVNDSIQRAITKVIARFGIGLYIYEGKLDATPKFPERKEAPAQTGYAPQPQKNLTAASEKQKDLVKRLLEEKGRTIEQYGLDSLETLTTAQASNLITNLMQLPKVEKTTEPKKEFDDDLPF